MAHFAELDSTNTVLRVVVISNEDLLDENGVEQESLGIQVCKSIFGNDTKWVQTSYNNKFRSKYAGIGYTYDKENDVFIAPQPFPWYVLGDHYGWVCPENVDPATGRQLTEEEILLRQLNNVVGDPQLIEE